MAGISSQARYRPHHPNPIILSALTTSRFIVILIYHPLIIMLVETVLSTELLLLRYNLILWLCNSMGWVRIPTRCIFVKSVQNRVTIPYRLCPLVFEKRMSTFLIIFSSRATSRTVFLLKPWVLLLMCLILSLPISWKQVDLRGLSSALWSFVLCCLVVQSTQIRWVTCSSCLLDRRNRRSRSDPNCCGNFFLQLICMVLFS